MMNEGMKVLLQTQLEEIAKEMEAQTNIDVFKKMKEILNASFGEDYNQIVRPTVESLSEDLGYLRDQLNSGSVYTVEILNKHIKSQQLGFNILIHFPQVTITNSRKLSHIIRDLYVKFTVRADGKMYPKIEGARTTYSEDEIRANYCHSHLHAVSPSDLSFSPFCLGTGEIVQPLTLLAQKFDDINFTMLCLHLKNYIAWESLEGNPFRHMQNIGNPLNNVENLLPTDRAKQISEKLLVEFMKLEDDKIREFLSVQLTRYQMEVAATDEMEAWLATMMLSKGERYWDGRLTWNNMLSFKDTSGNYSPINVTTRGEVKLSTVPVVRFKGEAKVATLIKTDTTIKKQHYANPKIIRELCRKLSFIFTKTAIEYKGTEGSSNPIRDIKEAKPADILPVQPDQF